MAEGQDGQFLPLEVDTPCGSSWSTGLFVQPQAPTWLSSWPTLPCRTSRQARLLILATLNAKPGEENGANDGCSCENTVSGSQSGTTAKTRPCFAHCWISTHTRSPVPVVPRSHLRLRSSLPITCPSSRTRRIIFTPFPVRRRTGLFGWKKSLLLVCVLFFAFFVNILFFVISLSNSFFYLLVICSSSRTKCVVQSKIWRTSYYPRSLGYPKNFVSSCTATCRCSTSRHIAPFSWYANTNINTSGRLWAWFVAFETNLDFALLLFQYTRFIFIPFFHFCPSSFVILLWF